MQLATWNVNSLNVRLPHVLDWLRENPIDVLCLQETKQEDSKFKLQAITPFILAKKLTTAWRF
jgi:exodeoxyribonuclease-3